MGNSAAGGANDGRIRSSYPLAFPLSREEMEPMARGVRRKIAKTDLSLIFIRFTSGNFVDISYEEEEINIRIF